MSKKATTPLPKGSRIHSHRSGRVWGKVLLNNDNKYFFRMFRYVKPYAFAYFFGKFMHGSQGFALPFIISVFSTSVMYAITGRNLDGVLSSALLLFGMIIGFLIPFIIGIYFNNVAEQKAVRDLKKELFRTFVRTGLEADKHSGEGIAAINTDADTASQVYAWPLSAFLIAVINIVFSSIVVFVVEWRIGIAALCIGIIGFALQKRFTKPLADVNRRWLAVNADTVKTVSNIFSGAITIRAFNMQAKAEQSFEPENDELRQLGTKEGLISAWQGFFSLKINWLTLIAVFGVGGYLVATSRMEFHMLMMLPLMCSTLTIGFDNIGRAYANLQGPIAGAKRVFAILDATDDNQLVTESNQLNEKTATGYGLNIKNLNFTYKSVPAPVLSDINLKIAENKMVALVGESGSGKSTLLRAIIGMYERDDLDITLGGINFGESSTKNWRKNFAYVDQSCKLFDMTIKENIAMGKGGKATTEEILDAARRAAAHDFIQQLENGYDTNCGEKGGTLSGGQKQRVAIARALVKKAPVLVFDEATSALDAQSERYIMETINSLRHDHTILITTHNLENVIAADQIVLMDSGRIAEIGTHEELMKNGGIYYLMYKEAIYEMER